MSISEVAKIAGVSQATVSRVINGHRSVRPATELLVRDAIEKVGYSPAFWARRRGPKPQWAARQGIRTGNIAVVWFHEANRLAATHFIQSLQSVSSALAEHGLNMVTACVTQDSPLPVALHDGDLDGMIVVVGEPHPDIAEKFKNIPTVWLSSRHSDKGDYVIGGNERIGQMAARYLVDRGHRELLLLNPFPDHPALKARGEGFRFEAFRQGLELSTLEGRPGACGVDQCGSLQELDKVTEPLARRLIELQDKRPGVFIPRDMITASVYRHLYAAGRMPGADLEIISADNEEPYLAALYPRPATIDIGVELNARHAVEQLIWRMRHPQSDRNIIISIEPALIAPN